MKTKQPARFNWQDEPSHIHPLAREVAAHHLRCYRRWPKRYDLRRVDRHVYHVANTYPGSPVGVIVTR